MAVGKIVMPDTRSPGFRMHYKAHGAGFPQVLINGLGSNDAILKWNQGKGRVSSQYGPVSSGMARQQVRSGHPFPGARIFFPPAGTMPLACRILCEAEVGGLPGDFQPRTIWAGGGQL